MSRSDEAKARLAALEAKPEHTTHPDPKAVDETQEGDLADPALNEDRSVDPGWHEDAKGNWHHVEYEGDDE